eukprot:TRINITY_DN2011_c0_g4_i2.p2 TRINITY_DN2011_c0_g4~~TRINITY_DN2011_c0_g4_i2.p2  ORF type:complete len:375 (-),score=55.40 TRINITY_DN2011_c0_g4_i2:327-1451(-)
MASPGENMNASQFYITTGENLDSLDEKHTIFGEVGEGLDVVLQINNLPTDPSTFRPLLNVRIWHTHVLFDPWEDDTLPPQLLDLIPPSSPAPIVDGGEYLEEDWKPTEDDRPVEVIEEEIDKREAFNRAVQLELVGDIPEAEVKPPSNMLFVCKLNPVTTEEDLEIIFARFGSITSCDVIRDWKTGDSLCYAFIGFDNDKSAEEAYFKMNNCIIDDRRIKVDFSQSVYTLWRQYRKFGKKGGGRQDMEENQDIQKVQQRSKGGQYDLLFETDNNERQPSGAKRHKSGDGNKRNPKKYRDRYRDREREFDGHRHRDRHERQVRNKNRSRSRSRSPKRKTDVEYGKSRKYLDHEKKRAYSRIDYEKDYRKSPRSKH